MVYLLEGNTIVGYAPMLKKEYSDEEILEMSKYSYYEGWSELSGFVMRMQGIEYKDDEDYGCAKYSVTKPINVSTDFAFECLWDGLENKECIKTYIKQIYDVFQNLKLYRIEQRSIDNMRKLVECAKEDMKFFISQHTIEKMDMDIERKLNNIKHITKNLNEMLDLFCKLGYPQLELFDIPSDEIIKYLNTERKVDKKLVCC